MKHLTVFVCLAGAVAIALISSAQVQAQISAPVDKEVLEAPADCDRAYDKEGNLEAVFGPCFHDDFVRFQSEVRGEEESKRLEKGDKVLVTDSSGNVVKGVVQESTEDGRQLTLFKAERYTLSERIHSISTGSSVAVTLKDGTRLEAPLAEVSSSRFALSVDADETTKAVHRGKVKKWISYEDVYSVFHHGKLSLDGGASVEAIVFNVDDSRQIERAPSGSGGKGALFGLLAGAGLAAVASAGCCGNPDVGPAQAFLFFAPVFGGAGAGIGYAIGKRSGSLELVYMKDPFESKVTFSLVPILTRGRRGLALSLTF